MENVSYDLGSSRLPANDIRYHRHGTLFASGKASCDDEKDRLASEWVSDMGETGKPGQERVRPSGHKAGVDRCSENNRFCVADRLKVRSQVIL